MNFTNLKASVQEDIIYEYALRVADDEDLIDSLNEIYDSAVKQFVFVYNEIFDTDLEEFKEVLEALSDDTAKIKLLLQDEEFVELFVELLEDPSQDDFYGTEGWEHYLGLD